MDQTRKLIADALPFGGLSDATLDTLAAFAEDIDVLAGDVIYEAGAAANDLYIVRTGAIRLVPPGHEAAGRSADVVRPGEAFGWIALARRGERRNRAISIGAARLLRLRAATLIDVVSSDPRIGQGVRENIVAATEAIRRPARAAAGLSVATGASKRRRAAPLAYALLRIGEWFRSPKPYLMALGYALLLGFWYLSVEALKLPRFAEMPGLTAVAREWFSRNPAYGVSIYTPVYYLHILVSLRQIAIAFALATALGVPVGLLFGWSKTFKDYLFPLFEILRPIPVLAWVPLAIIMLPGSEIPVIYLTFLASFFATALNTMLGVNSIDSTYILAAQCLGASRWQIFRHVIAPGALPFIFTGLQISIGVAWFSLVAAEMISGQFGLGYLINTSYTTVEYPTLVIAMITLGVVGYLSSALVRLAGGRLMTWRVRQLATEGRR